jgi:DNA-binding NarL/FixJ family response regulator
LDNLKGEVGAEVDTIEADTPEDTKVISVISQQSLECECISTSLKYRFPEAEIRCFDSPDAWEESFDGADTNEVVLYSLEESGVLETETKEELRRFVDKAGTRKVIVLSKSDDLNALFDVLECGAASYIPPDVGLNDLIEAMRISSTKSVVIPRKSILALRGAAIAGQEAENGLERYFTERQLAVARALQQGAANKTIAYQLDLRESTVKVHVRNIMRKLQATNRTQAAFKLNELANGNIEMDIAAKT